LTCVSLKDTMFPMNEKAIGANIRRIRLQSKQTLAETSKKANLTKSALSKIETGQISPPISTLIRIAKAIKVPVVELFVDEQQQPPYVLTRKDKGRILTRDGSKFGYSYESLALEKSDKYVEPFVLTVSPDDPPGQFHHSGQEFIYMLSGCLEVTVCEETMKLRTGDSLYFDSSHVHKLQAIGKRKARFICVFVQMNL
jgi:transcriptional regulator with XRE-family HTH domain